jgi:N-acetyl-gamma-glutamyl-phosphate reductase
MTKFALVLFFATLTSSATVAFVSQPSTFLRARALHAKPKVFIDGEAGTTGIQVRDRIASRDDLEVISAPTDLRKDDATRKKLINEADVVILCKFELIVRMASA